VSTTEIFFIRGEKVKSLQAIIQQSLPSSLLGLLIIAQL